MLIEREWKSSFLAVGFFMPPTFEVGGAYWFGPVLPCFCVSVMLCIWSRTVGDRILKFNIWNVHEK